MRRPALMFVLAGLVGALVAVPLAVYAAHSFKDVPDSNTFHADIAWLAAAGVTKGCNPPANTEFCPKDEVTREQMAAFMHRLAEYRVVDAGTLEGLTGVEWAASVRIYSRSYDHDGSPGEWGAYCDDERDAIVGGGFEAFAVDTGPGSSLTSSYPRVEIPRTPDAWVVETASEGRVWALCLDRTP